MKTKLSFLCSLFWVFNLYAQDPSITWQKTIGGSGSDFVYGFSILDNGHYLISGFSDSNISGEKNENSNGGIDIWITQMDPAGNIVQQNTIGGSGDDYLFSIKPTSDGGFIVGASSNSNISGDKTENSRGVQDFWILKLDANLQILWQKTLGGNNPEFEAIVIETQDGGFFVSGYSDSGVSGDKTVPSQGERDYWILKLDEMGSIEWQKSIGGSLNDRLQMSFQTIDGGFMLGGFSISNISGDKSENSRGLNDIWLVKINGSGTIEWDKTYGGNGQDILRDIIPTSDGGYLVGSYSESNANGEKSENSRGGMDYWLLKIQNNGSLSWNKTIGGSGIDYLRDLKELSDGNYLLSGYSNSNISGEKTQNSKGGYDLWLIKVNTSGEIIGQNTIGGSGDEMGPYIEYKDGYYYYALTTNSGISGDKTEDSRGAEDYWIFKAQNNLLNLSETSNIFSVQLYPNPTKGNFEIQLDRNYASVLVEIMDLSGKILESSNHINSDQIQHKTNQKPGIYLVQISLNGKEKIHKKLIIRP